jgi:two-component system, NtrC family, response regulator AtoC
MFWGNIFHWHGVCKTYLGGSMGGGAGIVGANHIVSKMEGLLEQQDAGFVLGTSRAMQTLEGVIAEIAPTKIPILLVGESGTGKEMFANRVHRLSGDGERKLTKISCAAMNAANFAAELRRHASRGGAASRQDAGTVFFDEVSELDAACQRSLLCALPDDEGDEGDGFLRARVVSATNRNLDDEMRAGRFRSELYYRINGVCLRLPPLRERKEDIAPLAEFFLTKHAAKLSRVRPSISDKALGLLTDHSWPGNIRELENVVKKIVVLGDEQLAIAELRSAGSAGPRKSEFVPERSHSLKVAARAASREAEREMILEALTRTRWNRKRAAQDLQISYKSLLYKLKQIGFGESKMNS